MRSAAALVMAGLCAAYLAAALAIWPSLMPDPSYGLLVHKSMRTGAAWNHLVEPRADNIAVDRSAFFATWSPGQYAVPGLLMDLGLSTGTALTIVGIAASLAGLAGWFWLFRELGFDWTNALIAGAMIAASRSFNYSFLSYVGSDLLAFAAFPILAAVLSRYRHSMAGPAVAVPALLVGFFAKNSMIVYLAAWIGGTAIRAVTSRRFARPAVSVFVATGLAVVATVAVIQVTYLSRGWTPLTYQPAVSASAATYFLPWAMPLLAATSWDDVLSWLFNHPSSAVTAFDYKHSTSFLALVAGLSGLAAWRLVRSPGREIATQALVFVALTLSVFTYLLATGSAASLDLSRHYRILGYVLLPFLVAEVRSHVRMPVKAAIAIVALVPCLYGVVSFTANWQRHYQQRASHSSRLQVTHLQLSPRVVRFLGVLDRTLPGGSTLVATPTPMHALEFSRTRVLATSVVSDSAQRIASTPRYGVADNLIVIAELAGMTEAEIQAWLSSFRGYAGESWDFLDVDGQRFYVPSGQAVNRAWLANVLATGVPE